MSITTATAITTAAIAVLVAIITWRQWITNRARLRHELFDRRYAVYEQITGFLADVLQGGRVPEGEPEGFIRLAKKAYFVFACDSEIRDLVSEIYRKAIDLHALEETLNDDHNERASNIQKQREIKNWYQDTLNEAETRFEKYLSLSH